MRTGSDNTLSDGPVADSPEAVIRELGRVREERKASEAAIESARAEMSEEFRSLRDQVGGVGYGREPMRLPASVKRRRRRESLIARLRVLLGLGGPSPY